MDVIVPDQPHDKSSVAALISSAILIIAGILLIYLPSASGYFSPGWQVQRILSYLAAVLFLGVFLINLFFQRKYKVAKGLLIVVSLLFFIISIIIAYTLVFAGVTNLG